MFSERLSLVEQKRALGEPIWSELFMVKMAFRDVLTTEQIRDFGMPSTGVEEIDREIRQDKVTCMITIDAMAEHYRAGRRVVIVNWPDLERIYDIIDKYLLIWAQLLEGALNTGDAPIEDLILLDEMANSLYEQSKVYNGSRLKNRKRLDSFFGDKVISFSKEALLGIGNSEAEKTDMENDSHKSLASFFSRHLRPKARTEKLSIPDGEIGIPRRTSWK